VTHSTNDGPVLGLGQQDETLAGYEARGGLDVLRNLPPLERTVEELKTSGLAGFGGAGFPTGLKWESVAREPGPPYVVVNADEGEPGTIKDRYVMELRPDLLVEGTLIAMRSLGATEGYVYLREEYATARELGGELIGAFTSGEADEVFLVYNEFKSVIQQRLIVDRLLPIERHTLHPQEPALDYLYEPQPAEIFASLLPRHVEVQVWKALLESQAAEHGARMTSMDAATNNASEMIERLTLYMNKVRQAAITKEIIEVVSGAGAPA